jgi:hypothetical protein
MERSDKLELASLYILFLAAMLAGYFHGQRSPAQIKVASHNQVLLRAPSSSDSQQSAAAPTSSAPSTVMPASDSPTKETLTFIPDLPMPAFQIQPVDPYEKEFGFGILDFLTGFSSTRISSTDKNTQGTASLVTKDNVNLGLRYSHLITPRFRTIFEIQDQRLDFLTPISNALTNPSINLVSFSVAGQMDFTRNLHGTLALGSDQVPFLKGVSLTQVTMDQLSVPDAALYVSWDIMDRHPFRFGAESFIKSYFPTSSDTYQSNTNLGFGGRLYLRQSVNSNLRFDLGVNAQYLNQNTTIVNQSQTDYGIDLKISIPIGGSFQ